VVLLAVPLAIILTALVAYGMAFLSRSVSGGFVGWLEGTIGQAAALITVPLQYALQLTKWLTHQLGAHFAGVEWGAVTWLSSLTDAIGYSAKSIAGIAYDLHDFSRWLVLTEIPKLVHSLPTEAGKAVTYVTKRVQTIERTVVKLPGLTKAQIRAAVAVAIPGVILRDANLLEWLRKHLKALERAAAGAAGAALGDVLHWERGVGGRLNRDLTGVRHRIGRLEKLLTASGAAALVVAGLAKLGLQWVRCSRVGQVGKALCGAPQSVIDNLLSLLVDVFVVTNICEVIGLLEKAADEFSPLLNEFVSVVDGALCHGDYQAAPGLGVPALNYPPSLGMAL